MIGIEEGSGKDGDEGTKEKTGLGAELSIVSREQSRSVDSVRTRSYPASSHGSIPCPLYTVPENPESRRFSITSPARVPERLYITITLSSELHDPPSISSATGMKNDK